jgi:Flp pilus assembly protein TadG
MTHHPLTLLRRLRRDRSGAAAIEFGLVSSMLITLLIPTVDLGMGAYNKMRVQNAAEAGAQYALSNSFSTSAIQAAAQAATTLGASATVTSSETCNCITGSGSTSALGTSVTCGSTCADGSKAGTYITVSTSTTYTPLIAYSIPGLHIASTMTFNGTAVVRIN